ncbi:MAG: DoxX family membrane protein [Bacteroidota bacterium]|nr:DoxX family membrane protein [Bacteroidota bacterium]
MQTIIDYHLEIAALIARVFLGLLFFFQGYDAIFNVKIENIIESFYGPFAVRGIPKRLTVIGVWVTSYLELIGGLLLTLGLFKYVSLYILGADIIIASIGFGIVKPMWDMQFVFPRLAILIFLMVIPVAWDTITIDYILGKLKIFTA